MDPNLALRFLPNSPFGETGPINVRHAAADRTTDLTGNVDTEIALGQHVFYRFLTGSITLTDPTWAAAVPTSATPYEGYTILLIFEQDGTGGHTVTPPSNFAFPDGFPASVAAGSKAFTVWTGVYYGAIGGGTTALNGWLMAVPTEFAAR